MDNYDNATMKEAYKKAGFREQYAMENGDRKEVLINSHKCFKFVYSSDVEYQDANGATYDTVAKSWIE